jgi:hypothetical protein
MGELWPVLLALPQNAALATREGARAFVQQCVKLGCVALQTRIQLFLAWSGHAAVMASARRWRIHWQGCVCTSSAVPCGVRQKLRTEEGNGTRVLGVMSMTACFQHARVCACAGLRCCHADCMAACSATGAAFLRKASGDAPVSPERSAVHAFAAMHNHSIPHDPLTVQVLVRMCAAPLPQSWRFLLAHLLRDGSH